MNTSVASVEHHELEVLSRITNDMRSASDLEAQVRDFLSGHAAVDPAKEACKNCDVIGLCRIIDRGVLEEDLEESADE